ncbi:hypothetical protein [Streptomyces sp. HNM0574]|uniref:hypothetical protein n=1 Tax=Streptomyces sp. HNM0574 TaxID=2714954 RepID=UPI00146C10AE|nr:hypothetical protein [Streptomyces sp. HNM0574]
MDAKEFDAELERRLRLLEDPGSGEGVLDPLPARDLWLTVLGLIAVSAVMLWWGYPG